MDNELIYEIVSRFSENTGIKAKWRPAKSNTDKHFNGEIDLLITSGNKLMLVEFKKNVQLSHMPAITKLHNKNDNMIVLGEDIIQDAKQYLKNAGISYMENAGNAFIKSKDLFILIDGKQKIRAVKEKSNPFSKTGLRVIFLLLINEELLNATIREIAKTANVSLDTAHRTINGLKKLGYIIALKKDKLAWYKKNELVEKWISEYELRLKPNLHIGNFKFVNENDFYNWQQLNLIDSKWSGEPAGEILTRNLKPQTLTLYTSESGAMLLKKYRMVPDPAGYIKVYKKFWDQDDRDKNTVHPLLVYADLINTGNSRNIEVAQKINEQYLQIKS